MIMLGKKLRKLRNIFNNFIVNFIRIKIKRGLVLCYILGLIKNMYRMFQLKLYRIWLIVCLIVAQSNKIIKLINLDSIRYFKYNVTINLISKNVFK